MLTRDQSWSINKYDDRIWTNPSVEEKYVVSNLKKEKKELYRITSYLGIMNKLINCYLYRAQKIKFIRNE